MSTTTDTRKQRFSMPSFLAKDTYMTRLVLVLILLLIFFAIIKPGAFFAPRTWQSMAVQFPEFGLMALGVMLTHRRTCPPCPSRTSPRSAQPSPCAP